MKNTTLTLVPQTAACVTSPRPKSVDGIALVGGNGIAGPIAGAAWLTTARKSMTAPSFHDRWPLRSAT